MRIHSVRLPFLPDEAAATGSTPLPGASASASSSAQLTAADQAIFAGLLSLAVKPKSTQADSASDDPASDKPSTEKPASDQPAADDPAGITSTLNASMIVRDLGALQPQFRAKLERVISRMKDEYGHDVSVTETWRSQTRQDLLLQQGRTTPGPVVTWTNRSLHTQGRAADLKIDGKWDNTEGLEHLQQIASQEGLSTLGARDPGHVEMREDSLATISSLAQITDVGVSSGTAGARQAGASQVPSANIISTTLQVAAVARVASVAQVAQVASVAQVARVGPVATVAQVAQVARVASVAQVAQVGVQGSAPHVFSAPPFAPVVQATPAAQAVPINQVGQNTQSAAGPQPAHAMSPAQLTPDAQVAQLAQAARVMPPIQNPIAPRAPIASSKAPASKNAPIPADASTEKSSTGKTDPVPANAADPRDSSSADTTPDQHDRRRDSDTPEPAKKVSELPKQALNAQQLNAAAPQADVSASSSSIVGTTATVGETGAAARAAAIFAMQDARDAQPVSHMTLQLDNGNGGLDRIRVGLHGAAVGATIDMHDPTAASEVAANIHQLASALQSRGLDPDSLRVRVSNTMGTTPASELSRVLAAGGDVASPTLGTLFAQASSSSSRSRGDAQGQRPQQDQSRQRARKDQQGDSQ